MAGHSPWSNIQARKGAVDKKRASIFTKLARNIMVAAREGGGDPRANVRLRMAIDIARSSSMPKENIERAVGRGTGELKEGAVLEAGVYEAYLPGGVAAVIETMSDNKNRTANEIKTVLTKGGGTFAAPGSVSYLFDRKVVARVLAAKEKVPVMAELELALIEAGADDIIEEREGVVVMGPVEKFSLLAAALEADGLHPEEMQLEFVPKVRLGILNGEAAILVSHLDDLDDVQAVYTNA